MQYQSLIVSPIKYGSLFLPQNKTIKKIIVTFYLTIPTFFPLTIVEYYGAPKGTKFKMGGKVLRGNANIFGRESKSFARECKVSRGNTKFL